MTSSRLLACLAVLSVASCLSAQRTWIVDRWNRPGADFSDLQSAVAAAVDGDVLLLRATAGPFSSADVYQLRNIQGKGLVIVGERGPGLPAVGVDCLATISGVPATSTMMFHDVTLMGFSGWNLTVSNCPGAVVFRNTVFQDATLTPDTWSGCALLVFEGCRLRLWGERLTIQQSTVMMSNTLVTKEGAQSAVGIPALVLAACNVHLDACTAIGATEWDWPFACSDAIVLTQGTTLRMSGATHLRGGMNWVSECNAITSTVGTNSIHYDPSTTFVGGTATGSSTFVMSAQTGIHTSTVGSTIHVDQSQPSLAPTLMVMSPLVSTPWTNLIGPVYVDPNFVWTSFDVAPAFGLLRRSITVPPTIPRGQWVGVQAFALDPQTASLLTSNATVVGVW